MKLKESSLSLLGGISLLGTIWGAPTWAIGRDFSPTQEKLRLNQIQVIGTHNSYHIQPSHRINSLLSGLGVAKELTQSLEYTHLPLQQQLEFHGIRQIELDVFADPIGGLYANPVGPLLGGFPVESDFPQFDRNIMTSSGLKVLHIQDIDYRTTCLTFISCLEEVKIWSNSNPNHAPILVLVEAKEQQIPPELSPPGIPLTVPLPFDSAALDAIDAEILSVFPTEKLLTPDVVRGPFETLKQAILNQGWPTLNQSKGKLMFALDNSGEIRQRYLEGHPSLQGRVLFTDSMLNDAEAAFFKRDNPFDSEIPELVRQGYLVLTRADADTIEARLNDSTRRDTALASGAQFISTDYPVPDLQISPYSVSFREGTTLRCNPINSPSECSFNAATIPEPSSLLGLLTFWIGCVRSKFLRQKKGNQK